MMQEVAGRFAAEDAEVLRRAAPKVLISSLTCGTAANLALVLWAINGWGAGVVVGVILGVNAVLLGAAWLVIVRVWLSYWGHRGQVAPPLLRRVEATPRVFPVRESSVDLWLDLGDDDEGVEHVDDRGDPGRGELFPQHPPSPS